MLKAEVRFLRESLAFEREKSASLEKELMQAKIEMGIMRGGGGGGGEVAGGLDLGGGSREDGGGYGRSIRHLGE